MSSWFVATSHRTVWARAPVLVPIMDVSPCPRCAAAESNQNAAVALRCSLRKVASVSNWPFNVLLSTGWRWAVCRRVVACGAVAVLGVGASAKKFSRIRVPARIGVRPDRNAYPSDSFLRPGRSTRCRRRQMRGGQSSPGPWRLVSGVIADQFNRAVKTCQDSGSGVLMSYWFAIDGWAGARLSCPYAAASC